MWTVWEIRCWYGNQGLWNKGSRSYLVPGHFALRSRTLHTNVTFKDFMNVQFHELESKVFSVF